MSEQFNLPKSTLRFWEKEFSGFVSPTRTRGGQRRYSEKDMEVIAYINRLKHMGLSLSKIKEQLQHGSDQHEDMDLVEIDALAERIAHSVKKEIYKYFGIKGNMSEYQQPSASKKHPDKC